LTKFIYSFLIGISLLLIPQVAYADEILIELTPDIAYVDTVVEVNGPTEYVIETTTGPRFEQAPNGTQRERVDWIDSWLQLRQGDTILRQDDDSNHNTETNYYASKLTGTLNTGSYTIRATSYDYIVAGQSPIGTYTLTSNLINLPEVEPETPEILPPPLDPLENQTQIPVPPEPTPPPVVEPIVDTIVPTVPDIVVIEPPIIIPVPPEPPLVEEILPEPEPPMEVAEPPAPAEEPPAEPEIAPIEEELPPIEVDAPPIEEEAPPAEAEEPPIEVVQADEVELETLAPETPVQLDNGVVLEAGTVVALQLLESPAELIAEIFTNPGQVLTALSNIGADMSEEERTESEQTIIASVIATQAAVNAVGAATMARTPTSTPSGGGAPSANDNIKLYKRRKP
jgi:hypothetical protein